MKRGFEVARKIADGAVVLDENGKEVLWGSEEELMPEYSTKCAAGADFKCAEEIRIESFWKKLFRNLILKNKPCSTESEMIPAAYSEKAIKALYPSIIHTGIKAFMQEDEVLYIFSRSSTPRKKGLIVANSVGVIDADYYGCEETDGEICLIVYNILPWDVVIHKGERIAQGVFHKFLRAENAKVGGKRTGGQGSTDK